MWCSDRRTLLAAFGLLPLAACGFTPLYGEGTSASAMQGRIGLDTESTRMGFELREQLERRLGTGERADHVLTVRLDVDSEDTVIQRDRSITRYTLHGEADYQLGQGERTLVRGTVRSVTAYNATASPFATDAAAKDAERRLAITLADQIVTRLAASSGDWLT